MTDKLKLPGQFPSHFVGVLAELLASDKPFYPKGFVIDYPGMEPPDLEPWGVELSHISGRWHYYSICNIQRAAAALSQLYLSEIKQ